MDTVKLMDGLEIKFGDDGTWLSFSTSSGSGSTVRLESLASQAGIVGAEQARPGDQAQPVGHVQLSGPVVSAGLRVARRRDPTGHG